jgi:hypothetical protein
MPERPGDRGLGRGLTLFGAIIAVQGSLTLLVGLVGDCAPCELLVRLLLLGPVAGLMGALVISSVLAPPERENLWFVTLIGLVVSVLWPGFWLLSGLSATPSSWLSVLVAAMGAGVAAWGETLKA